MLLSVSCREQGYRQHQVCLCVTCITSDGPPLTISAGICDSGQFSMLMICRLEHSASSSGREWRFALSLTYRDSNDSSVPIVNTLTQQEHKSALLSYTQDATDCQINSHNATKWCTDTASLTVFAGTWKLFFSHFTHVHSALEDLRLRAI